MDRIRIGVREGILNAEDVSIIYFEPNADSISVHNIRLDQYGNMEDAPTGYREFFSHEIDRALGFA